MNCESIVRHGESVLSPEIPIWNPLSVNLDSV